MLEARLYPNRRHPDARCSAPPRLENPDLDEKDALLGLVSQITRYISLENPFAVRPRTHQHSFGVN
jgi:hypothetical protein